MQIQLCIPCSLCSCPLDEILDRGSGPISSEFMFIIAHIFLLLQKLTVLNIFRLPYSRQWPKVSDFVARFCTLRESENTLPCTRARKHTAKSHALRVRISHGRVLKRVQILHGSVFSDLHNVQKRATKSDTLGHCLPYS